MDINYIVRFLALAESLNQHEREYHIYALCLDNQSTKILKILKPSHISLIPLTDLEAFDLKLFSTKPKRHLVDYYQTITPCYLLYIFESFPTINQLTYLDPDIYIFSDPTPVFDEIGKSSIALVPNNFSPNREAQKHHGKFGVSWLTLRRNKHALNALNWFRDKCIEWCYDRIENNKYGDQGYLELLAKTFPNVVQLNRPGIILGVWNIDNFQLNYVDEIIVVSGYPIISFHFQGVWADQSNQFDCELPENYEKHGSIITNQIYHTYCKYLFKILSRIQASWPEVNLKRIQRYDLPALLDSQKQLLWSLETVGNVPWNRKKELNAIEEFHQIYTMRPIKDNSGGVQAPHAFALWFMARELAPEVIVESGIFKGMTTWLLENACPDAKIISIDIHLDSREYISENVQYVDQDFSTQDWSNVATTKSLVFFDDHQNAYDRIQQCKKFGFKHIIFEDNYPPLQGDCYSLKKIFAGTGLSVQRETFLVRNLYNIRHGRPVEAAEIKPNQKDAAKIREVLDIYYEFPPVFRKKLTRWGDEWSDHLYPTPKALMELPKKDTHSIYWNDATNYTWMCYARLK